MVSDGGGDGVFASSCTNRTACDMADLWARCPHDAAAAADESACLQEREKLLRRTEVPCKPFAGSFPIDNKYALHLAQRNVGIMAVLDW